MRLMATIMGNDDWFLHSSTHTHTHTHTRTHPFRIANLNQREVRHLHIDCCMDGFWIVQDIGNTTQGQNNHVIWIWPSKIAF